LIERTAARNAAGGARLISISRRRRGLRPYAAMLCCSLIALLLGPFAAFSGALKIRLLGGATVLGSTVALSALLLLPAMGGPRQIGPWPLCAVGAVLSQQNSPHQNQPQH
jgi:hypothetical protein